MLVIATESMTGTIDKGDAVVYERYDGGPIEKGQVIIFEKNGVTTVHRVVDVENINGETRYYTKGDANESQDIGYITSQYIVGTTDLTIKYIGHPTLWMRQIFK
jgi:signal peptidase